ncbi:hypothetical protein K2173_024964 [Erythroxylum novogranatense]|uniref:Proteasome subunit beta n=1 Tax=Erythroxylum novogranatense TaxID=1862640 RepID=A0AAV8UE48_9ROSI|nr:hypothetical protein K2173_024964 [Erythroxylum novogranatense]
MTKQQANWSSYDFNGGTCVAIAGAGYCVIAVDTRMFTGYNILTRDNSKICKLADKSILASSGFQADVQALQKVLSARHLYLSSSDIITIPKQVSCPTMAQLLSNTLYYKRFFPYYAFNVLGGLENKNRLQCQGSGSTLIMPFLDDQLKSPSPLLLPAQFSNNLLVKTAFASTTERDICTGDKLKIVELNAHGVCGEYEELRKD